MRHPRIAVTVALLAGVLTLAACEEDAGDGGGEVPTGSGAVVTGPTVITPDSQAPLTLQEGIYRVTWKTTGCPSIKLAFIGDNGFSKEKTTTLPTQSWLIPGVPDGTYQIGQTDESCTDWQLTVERIGG